MTNVLCKCPNCSQRLVIEGVAVGAAIECTECGWRFAVTAQHPRPAEPLCPSCRMPGTRADVYCKYCGCNFDTGPVSLLGDYFRRVRIHRLNAAVRLDQVREREKWRLTIRFALVIGFLFFLVEVGNGIRERREKRERDAAFSAAIDMANQGRPTQQAIGALTQVMAKYPEAEQARIARNLLGNLEAKREQERAAVDAAIEGARSAAGLPDCDRALASLTAAVKENPDAPNLGAAARAESDMRRLVAEARRRQREEREREEALAQRQLAAQRQAEDAARARQSFDALQKTLGDIRLETMQRAAVIEDMRTRRAGRGAETWNAREFGPTINPRGLNW